MAYYIIINYLAYDCKCLLSNKDNVIHGFDKKYASFYHTVL